MATQDLTSPIGRPGKDSASLSRLESQPAVASLTAELLLQAPTPESLRGFLSQGLPGRLRACGAELVAIAALEAGRWSVLAEFGSPRTPPAGLMADALDREETLVDGSWIATPVAAHAARGEALAFHVTP